MLLVDVLEKKVIRDEELKLSMATSRPLGNWLKQMVSVFFSKCLQGCGVLVVPSWTSLRLGV